MTAKDFPVEVGIRLSEEQADMLHQEAGERGLSIAAAVRFALYQTYFKTRKGEEKIVRRRRQAKEPVNT